MDWLLKEKCESWRLRAGERIFQESGETHSSWVCSGTEAACVLLEPMHVSKDEAEKKVDLWIREGLGLQIRAGV